MTTTLVYPDWKEKVIYPAEGAQPQTLAENETFKALVAGLEAGQKIPPHPATIGIYHFLEGSGVMVVNQERIAVKAGTTVITADGDSRGVEAETRLAFIAIRISS
ncbi:MAG: hypothetical protein IT308_09950 [Anaerolineaceae bacterium]|nr:hypothetical protein [Anaerolineaceae bacterium]